jgi:hypothetical protein
MNLRPMSIADILDFSLELLFKRIWLFTAFSILIQCPAFIIGYYSLKFIGLSLVRCRSMETSAVVILMIVPLLIFIAAAFLICKALLIAICSPLFISRPFSLSSCMEKMAGRLASIIALSGSICLVSFLAYGCPLIFSIYAYLRGRLFGDSFLLVTLSWIVPSLALTWLNMKLFFALPAVIIEQKGVREALQRSWELSDNVWWKTWGLWALTRSVIFVSGLPLLWYVPVVGIFYYLTIFPLASSCDTVLYYDILIRREAIDLFLWAEENQEAGHSLQGPSGREPMEVNG